jgi:hypothetical protein
MTGLLPMRCHVAYCLNYTGPVGMVKRAVRMPKRPQGLVGRW